MRPPRAGIQKPKDPPWRVSMTEMSFINIDGNGNIFWVIDKTLWKSNSATPIFFAGIFRPLQTTSNHFRSLQTASNHFNQPLQTTPGPKWSVHSRSPGPAGPKIVKSDFFFLFYCLAKCTKYDQNKSKKVIFREFFFEKPHCRAKLRKKNRNITKSINVSYFDVF